MSSWKRIFFWLAGGIGLFLVLLAALLLLLPRLIDRDWSRGKIARKASALVGGTVEIQGSDLHYWPLPHVEVRRANVDIHGKATGTIRSLVVFPRIAPLFWGKVQASELHIEAPTFTVTIPEKPASGPEKKEDVAAPASLEEKLRSVLDSMARSAPDLRLVLTDGRVDVSERGLPPLSFREIEGSVVLPPAGPDLELSCAGTLWEQGTLEGRFEGGSLAGAGRIVLKGFRPHLLAGSLFPGSKAGISDSDIDLDLKVETAGWAKLRAEGDVSLSSMNLYRGKRRLTLTGGTVKGTLVQDGEKITAALTQLSLDSPRLSISGNLFLDEAARQARADAQALQVDVASVRKHALALAGDDSLVKDVFSIVKAGTIPVLAFRAEGKSAADLGELENMEFTGRSIDGKITVDAGEADLNIDRVRGNLAISQGRLEANGLEGSMGKIAARDGTLRMGFLESDTPFHLEANVAANVAELPPLLNLLITSKSYREELSLVEDWKGNTSGKLILGETLEALRVTVEVDAMNFSAKYQRLPYPLKVSGGQLFFRDEEIAATGVRGTMGKSTFSGASWTIRMTEPPSLAVRSGEFRLSLGELYPWALATEGLSELLAKIQGVGGITALSVTRLEGPALAPREWSFDATGNVERLSFTTPFVPGTIDVAKGKFRATRETLFFEDLHAKFLDASIAVSVSLEGYRTDVQRGVATVSGRLGPEAIAFFHDRGEIPPGFLVHSPLESLGVRVEWQKDALVALNGDFVIGNGPKVSVDLLHPPGEWVVRNLSLLNEDSKASLSFHWKPESLDLAFEGHLSEETENRLFVTDSPSGNWIKGNFRASLRFDQPMASTAWGTLEGKKLLVLQRMKIPVLVDSLSLSAEGSRVALKEAKITIGNSHVLMKGEAAASPDGLTFDMDASTPGLDWESLQEAFGTPEAKEMSPAMGSGTVESRWDVPVRGTLRLRSGYFRYGPHTVEPATAEIVFGKPGVTTTITEAAYCGIPFTGTLLTTSGEMAYELRANAKDGDIDSVYDCLTDDKGRVTGRFDLAGEVEGRVREGEDPIRSLRGNLDFTSKNGRIKRTPILSRVLSFLNVTEVFRGKLPDMRKEGLKYLSVSIRGDIEDGTATITEYVLDGTTVDVVGQGRIDLVTRECDLQMLAAPFKTVNYVVGKIPLLRHILGGKLVEVPVKVSGTTADPKVSLLNPSSVGKNLVGIVERTFKLPVELIRPVLPGKKSADR
jgi:hypothetical protein